jgi:lysophospholipase L1-like esterase
MAAGVAVGAAALSSAVGLVAATPPVAAATAGHVQAADSSTGLSYVAMGDSYTSAPGVAPASSASSASSACGRSDANYAQLTARALGLSLTDVSCSGATTADVSGSQWAGSRWLGPQLDALGPGTDVVSLGIGGNDIGFTSIMANCVALSPWGPTRVGRTCQAHYDAGGRDQLAAAVAATGPKVGRLLEAIHARAPGAAVYVIGYPDILPISGGGCWPELPFASADLSYLRSIEAALNDMLASVASRDGATYVDTFDPSLGHDACAGAARWISPAMTSGVAMHPNAEGEAAMATALITALQAAGYR